MIARDRDLLARVGQVNAGLGEIVVELMTRQDGGELSAGHVRELAERLGGMAAELYQRAAELEDGQTPSRVVIDAQVAGAPT